MGFTDWLGDKWEKLKTGALGLPTAQWDYAEDLYNIATGPADVSVKDRIANGWLRSTAFGRTQVSNIGGVISPVTEAPGVQQVGAGLTWLQKNLVNRPIATAAMSTMQADLAQRDGGWGSFVSEFFTPGVWKKAWQDSEKVTAGQALTYKWAVDTGMVDPDDPNFDPRVSKERYYNDWFFQTSSGALDFGLAFVDPLKGLGKLTRAGKARLVDKVVTADEINAGALEKQAFGKTAERGMTFEEAGGQLSPAYERAYQHAASWDEGRFNRTYFSQYAYGGVVSTALSAAAKQGDRGMFADVLNASRGDYVALDRLATYYKGSAVSNAIERYRDPWGTANVQNRRLDDPEAGAVATARDEYGRNSFIDQNTGEPDFELAGIGGSLTGAGVPKPRFMDWFREGVHSYGNSSYAPASVPLWRSPLNALTKATQNAARIVDSSHGYTAHLDVNAAGSYRDFRANLERAGQYLDDEARNRYVTAYMAALSPNDRSRVAAQADNHVIGRIANENGLSRKEAEDLIREADRRRTNLRNLRNTQQKFMPNELRRRADDLLRAGDEARAAQLRSYADQYEAAAANGEVPNIVEFTSDERGNVVAVPRVEQGSPVLTSQMADYVPMMDYHTFNGAINRIARARQTIKRYEQDLADQAAGLRPRWNISEKTYNQAKTQESFRQATGAFNDVYEAFMHAWSVIAVLRPAQTLRNLADEGMRSLTMVGMVPTMVNGSRGALRVGYNIGKRGHTRISQWQADRALRSLNGNTHVEVPVNTGPTPRVVEDFAPVASRDYTYQDALSSPVAQQFGDTWAYESLEGALVDGKIDLDTYTDFLPWAVRQGRAPLDVVAMVEDYAGGHIKEQTFRQQAAVYALDATGRSAFANPRWQSDLIDAVNGTHSRNGILADPLSSDAARVLDSKVTDSYELLGSREFALNPRTGELGNPDAVYDFVRDHLDRFLSGSYRLHAKRTPDGSVRLAVARPLSGPKSVVEGLSEAQKRQVRQGLKVLGGSGVRLVGDRTIEIPGSLSGMDGDYARRTVSATHAPYSFLQANRNADRALSWSNDVSKQDIRATVKDAAGNQVANTDYGPAWERTVNQQISNDDVARRFMSGQSRAEVLEWLESGDPRAERYLNDRGLKGLSYQQHAQVVEALVNYHLPALAGQGLRDKALQHEATFDDFARVVPEDQRLPVNGQVTETSLGVSKVQKWVSKKLDQWFRVMVDKPADFLVRFPYYDTRYRQYFQPMFDAYVKQTDRALVSQAEVNRISRMAKQRAMDDVKRYMYDSAYRTDMAAAVSGVMPFSNAIADSLFKWGRIAWARPLETLSNWNMVFNAPERLGLVYDQDGNSLHYENGREVWRSAIDGTVMPDDYKHDRYVAFQVPSWIKPHVPGGLSLVTFNKSSLTTAVFDPSVNVGPLLALPVNYFSVKNPKIGENQFVKSFVLPFGPSNDPTNLLLPGFVRQAQRWYSEDEHMASSSAMAIYQTQWVEYRQGKRQAKPSIDEAMEASKAEQALRFFTSQLSPLSFQYNTPYKPFIDQYSQLLRKHQGDDVAAMEEFRTLHPDDYDAYLYLTARVTKANIPIPATVKGFEAFQKQQGMIAKYPDLAGMITGDEGAGAFSKSVYEWQKQQTYDETGKKIREENTIADSFDDLQRKAGWAEYSKYMALVDNDLMRRGLNSMRDKGAEDILARYNAWVAAMQYKEPGPYGELQLSPWYKDFRQTDGASMEARLLNMQQLLMENPGWVSSRAEFQGLAEYLNARQRMKTAMASYGYASLDSVKADWLQTQWNSQVFQLRNQNPAFGKLYTRWLTRDTLASEGLAAAQIVELLEGGGDANG